MKKVEQSRQYATLLAFDWYQDRRNFSPRTTRTRRYVLRGLAQDMHPRPILGATVADIEHFLDSRRLGPQSRYSYLAHIHAFYRWAMRAGLATADPTIVIDRPILPRRLPRPIPSEELDAALDGAGPAMRAWLLLGAYAGFRVSDMAGLERSDILDAQEPYLLRVDQGKGKKDAVLPLHPLAYRALLGVGLPASGPVFVHPNGRRCTSAWIGKAIAAHLRSVGADRTAHSLRHFFGTESYRLSKDILLVKRLMRHASVKTTELYVALDPGPEAVALVNRLGA